MAKSVNFGSKPAATAAPPTAEQWVEQRIVEGTKRLTLDLPASLHTRIKTQCSARGRKMVDEIRAILEREFPA